MSSFSKIIAMAGGLTHAQLCDSGVSFSGPIAITKGGSYTGNWESTDVAVPAVNIETNEPVTIVNSRFKGPGDLILTVPGEILTVQQSCFVGTNPNVAGASKGSAIHAFRAASVDVERCDFDGVGFYGIWVQEYLGDHSLSNTIKILNNRVHNVDGRLSDGKNGYLTMKDSGYTHAIILSDVHDVPGIEIAWNQIINEPYQSGVGDSINIFESSGTPSSAMQLHDNYVQGGYEGDPAMANQLSYSGSAITTDGFSETDPSVATGFLDIHDNQAVNFGNVGISIALGHDIAMYSNRAVSSGQLVDGANITTSYASGIDHQNYRNDPPGVFGNNSVHDNLAGMRRQRSGNWERFDYYFGIPPAIGFNNAKWVPFTPDSPNLADEANELKLWEQKLVEQGISVGSNLVAPVPNPLINTGEL